MKLKIKTLTPIHIGSGEKYNALGYIKKDDYLYFLDFNKIKQVLNKTQLEEFCSWILEERDRPPTLEKFIRDKLNDKNGEITKKLISKATYKVQVYFKEDPQKKQFLGDIETFIKQNNKVYIPGSEIKGAIRTAVLYKLLSEDKNLNFVKNELTNLKENNKKTFDLLNKLNKPVNYTLSENDLKEIPEEEQNLIFHKSEFESKKKKITIGSIKKFFVKTMKKIENKIQDKVFLPFDKYDAKYDLFKFLIISDSDSKTPDESLFVSDIDTIGVSRRFKIFQELLKENQEFFSEFVINKNEILLNKLGFSNKQREVLDYEKIFECCYEFTNRIIEEEIRYFKKDIDIKNQLEKIKNNNKKDSPVLRIGKNEGFLSLTVGLLIKEKFPDLYNNVLIHTTKGTSYTNNFPKTRKIANLKNNQKSTLGWIKLEIVKDSFYGK